MPRAAVTLPTAIETIAAPTKDARPGSRPVAEKLRFNDPSVDRWNRDVNRLPHQRWECLRWETQKRSGSPSASRMLVVLHCALKGQHAAWGRHCTRLQCFNDAPRPSRLRGEDRAESLPQGEVPGLAIAMLSGSCRARFQRQGHQSPFSGGET